MSARDRPDDWDHRRAVYWQALVDGDPTQAMGVALGLNESGMGVVDVLEDLVAPAQIEVGRLWAANRWNVAQEHRATSVSEEVVAALAGRIPPAEAVGTVVVTCIDGEWHSLPSRVVAAALRSSGWRVHHLGASVPGPHLAQLIHDVGPDLVALSCSLPTGLPRARAMIEASRQAGVPVLVGGPGFGPGGRWGLRIGADATAATAREAAEVISSPGWPRFTDPAPPLVAVDAAADLLSRNRVEITAVSGRRLAALYPGVRQYTPYQAARTEEDLGYLVDFLAAALYVDDPGLYTGFIGWMASILGARGIPVPALDAGLSSTEEAVAEVVGDLPRAQHFLALARQSLLAGG